MKLATSAGDFDRFCGSYMQRIQQVYLAGFRYIDLSLYTVMQTFRIAKACGYKFYIGTDPRRRREIKRTMPPM